MKLLFALVAMFVVSGCQTVPYQGVARDVKRKPGVGGTIAVQQTHAKKIATKRLNR